MLGLGLVERRCLRAGTAPELLALPRQFNAVVDTADLNERNKNSTLLSKKHCRV